MSTQGHLLYKLCRASVSNVACHSKFQDHRTLGSEEEDFKGFGHIYVLAWRPSWPCNKDDFYKIYVLVPRRLHIKFGFDWPSGLREKDV